MAANAAMAAAGEEPEAKAYFDPSLKPASTVEYESVGCRIQGPRVLDLDGSEVNVLVPGKSYLYTYDVEFERPASTVRFGMMLKTTTGVELAGIVSHPEGRGIEALAHTRYTVTFRFSANLNPGNYFMNAGVTGAREGAEDGYLHRLLDAAMVRVPPRKHLSTSGYVNLAVGIQNPTHWECKPAVGQQQALGDAGERRRQSDG